MLQDLRFALRQAHSRPTFTLIVVAILALGLGANAAIFSVINAVLLHPLPYPHPDRLVLLFERDVLEPGGGPNIVALANFLDWQKQSRSFDGMAAGRGNRFSLGADRGFAPEEIQGAIFTSSVFPVVGVQPIIGRSFRGEEDQPGAARVVVIGYGLWQQRYGGSAEVLHHTITLDGQSYQIVGVMPEGFAYPRRDVQVWVPLLPLRSAEQLHNRGDHEFYAVGRLKSGVPIDRARAELDSIQHRIWLANGKGLFGRGAAVFPLNDRIVQNSKTTLQVLFVAVGCVLLIACVNIANLLLARGAQRQREIAIRAALGAGWGRLVRQLLTESVLLASFGAAMGLLLASWLTDLFARQATVLFGRSDFDPPRNIQLDWWVFAFTAALAIAAGVLSGLVPALSAAKTDLTARLKDNSRSTTAGRGQHRFRYGLVTAEVALSVVLLVSAGLLVRSFVALRSVHPGVRTDHLLTAGISLPDVQYDKRAKIAAFAQHLTNQLKTLPGVRSVGLVSCLPVDGYCGDSEFSIEGRPTPAGQFLLALNRAASPGYFATVGIPILRGRTFTDRDGMGYDEKHLHPSAVIISESMAREFWPNEDPIGKRIYYGDEKSVRFEVIGICGDVILSLDDKPRAMMYQPLLDGYWTDFYAAVQTVTEPQSVAAAVRSAVNHEDPNLPIFDVRTMADLMQASAAHQQFTMLLIGSFALVALILAAVGLYGVLYYVVSQRTNEIGIRVVLGATSGEVHRLILWQGMQPATAGIALGLGAAVTLTRYMESLLFGVKANDPATFGAVAAVLAAVALVACSIPAIRATRIDPAVALRTE